MSNSALLVQQAEEVLKSESDAILSSITRLGDPFVAAVNMILRVQGRLIVTGMGKPGYIARKIAATLMSTGTPACYLHPAEGIHGDLGMITRQDIILMLSNSGETAEIVNILPAIRHMGVPIIAICGNVNSTLARHADVVIDAAVEKEACPLNLAPTTSTTLALALGDALAVVLMKARQFTPADFAQYHPGGALGRKLLLTVKNVMHSGKANPTVSAKQAVTDALFVMTDKGLGAVSVIDEDGRLLGLITDGDIRRCIAKDLNFLHLPVTEIMSRAPLTITQERLASEAIYLMENHRPKPITLLPVIDSENKAIGLVHITDLLGKDVF